MKLGFSGRFDLTAHKVRLDQDGNPVLTGESRQLASFDNLILDAGLERIGTNSAMDGCCVGTGNSTPVATQTQLDSLLGVTTTINESGRGAAKTDAAPFWSTHYYVYRFAAGKATGNLSEVGIGWGADPNAKTMAGLWSRALIKDASGNPTTITVLADEILDVRYTLQLQVPVNDVTGTVKIGADSYDYIIRPAKVTTRRQYENEGWNAEFVGYQTGFNLSGTTNQGIYAGIIGDVKDTPTGERQYASTFVTDSYATGSKQAKIFLNLGLNDGNVSGGIRSILVQVALCAFQIQFSRVSDGATIPKDNTKTLKIPFVVSWGRANAAQ